MKIKTGAYNMDTGTVDVVCEDGKQISILCNRIEETLPLLLAMRTEYSRLIYEEPIQFAELVLTDNLQPYLREYQQSYREQERDLRKQLEKYYPAETAREIAREFMTHDS
ncbi:MAG: DUF6061 family protein [Bacillota bacterium]